MPSECERLCLFYAAVHALTGPQTFAPLVRWVFIPNGECIAIHNGQLGYWQKELVENGH